MTSVIKIKKQQQIKLFDLDINGKSTDSSPDLLSDTLIIFKNGQQNGAKQLLLNKFEMPGRATLLIRHGNTAISQSTLNTWTSIPESEIQIPASGVYHTSYIFIFTTAATTTGMKIRLNLGSTTTMLCGNGVTATTTAGVGQYVTFTGDTTTVGGQFTAHQLTSGMIVGDMILNNTDGSNSNSSFLEFTTEVDTSAVTIPANADEGNGRFFISNVRLA